MSPSLRDRFERDGYVVVRGLRDSDYCVRARQLALAALEPVVAPAEYEADVGYPGSPGDRAAIGGDTPRRLLNAYAREAHFRRFAGSAAVAEYLAELNNESEWSLSQCHHNCVMTKFPGFSSATLWHQDIRYWSFDRPELVSVWLALGDESPSNGALRIVPGTHKMDFDRGRLDAELFLRPKLDANAELIRRSTQVELSAGDALFFHCRTFHAAGRNSTEDVKLSLVFTYHQSDNHPIPGTRSAQHASIPLPVKEA